MNTLLKPGQMLYTELGQIPCKIEQVLGSGSQGEVYRAKLNGKSVAVKWYFPYYLPHDPQLRDRLQRAVAEGAPSDRFLWPLALVTDAKTAGFGYVMSLRDPQYKDLMGLMKRRVEPSFWALATAGFELADSFLQLHSKGLCYRDISFGNVFFEPKSGHVLICDNDNVDIDQQHQGGVAGTPRFMAPEIVRGEAAPSRSTDLYSLAVLLFYMLMMHHPLEGKQEQQIRCMDSPAMRKLYGSHAVFIFDPQDESNRPVADYQQNALAFWGLYPQFLRDRFIQTFTEGIRNASSGRVEESEWRQTMLRLRDAILYCPHCGAENFYDLDVLQTSNGQLHACWQCQKAVTLPPRIRFGKAVVMLNHDTQLFPHHVDPQRRYALSGAIATVSQHPINRQLWGLKNCSAEKWGVTLADNTMKDVEPGQSVMLAAGTRINFGRAEGEIRA